MLPTHCSPMPTHAHPFCVGCACPSHPRPCRSPIPHLPFPPFHFPTCLGGGTTLPAHSVPLHLHDSTLACLVVPFSGRRMHAHSQCLWCDGCCVLLIVVTFSPVLGPTLFCVCCAFTVTFFSCSALCLTAFLLLYCPSPPHLPTFPRLAVPLPSVCLPHFPLLLQFTY